MEEGLEVDLVITLSVMEAKVLFLLFFPDIQNKKWYFVTKIVPTYCEKFFLRSLEQFIQTVGTIFGNIMLVLKVSHI